MITAAPREAGRRRAAGMAALLLAGGLLAGCAGQSSVATTFEQPVALGSVDGSALPTLTLTPEAKVRIGLETAVVQQDGAGLHLPYAALLYKADGTTWVYTSPKDLVYTRHAVTVGRVDGNSVLITVGPPAGTTVVVTGAAELFGAEFNTAE